MPSATPSASITAATGRPRLLRQHYDTSATAASTTAGSASSCDGVRARAAPCRPPPAVRDRGRRLRRGGRGSDTSRLLGSGALTAISTRSGHRPARRRRRDDARGDGGRRPRRRRDRRICAATRALHRLRRGSTSSRGQCRRARPPLGVVNVDNAASDYLGEIVGMASLTGRRREDGTATKPSRRRRARALSRAARRGRYRTCRHDACAGAERRATSVPGRCAFSLDLGRRPTPRATR